MLREFQRERHNLKEKSVAMIEAQVEEQKQKLQKEMEAARIDQRKGDLHEKLGEQKAEHQRKMKIIEEIKRDKARHERQAQLIKDRLTKARADDLKIQAQNYKDHKEINRLRQEQRQKMQEEEDQRRMQELVRKNKDNVNRRQADELVKIHEKVALLEEKKLEPKLRQEKLDRAVENYAFRPQVELDPDRVLQETDSREIRKALEFDKADKVNLNSNTGFTADKLMSDVRYKISAALHNAGLQDSTYANQVLTGLNQNYQ